MATALEERLLAVQRERRSATAGIGIAMLWLLQDSDITGMGGVVRAMANDMNLFEDDFRKADAVERIECNGWGLDDLIEVLSK